MTRHYSILYLIHVSATRVYVSCVCGRHSPRLLCVLFGDFPHTGSEGDDPGVLIDGAWKDPRNDSAEPENQQTIT